MSQDGCAVARREFLRFLAASPYVAAVGGIGAFLQIPSASAQRAAPAQARAGA